ncbi:TonB-dependent receptor plug domain-containing protein [Ferrimonas balearica]|uniref:TonB-dependent receptor plug domain-containing protein n=1 Tax=Ferrimonas balearica TaxID=44012 RepID=UPI001C994A0E|nr:TonB-dependent receptor [Ferrimonas balearica]MBY5920270.1 TonB-dependent receptor [Ferrimonas balearica]MBY5997045.1 TonB-dependent receptor [Ferrimonas balearica]
MNKVRLLVAIALAQTAPSVLAVDEVMVVTHRTLEESLALDQARLGNSLVIVEREQIEQFGQGDINDILAQLVPGLFAAGKGGRFDGAYYSLQGSRKQDILWLIDGNRLNNRLYGGIYLDSLNPNIIERIEVLKGGQGIIYGSDAIAGVINIVTRNYQGESETSVNIGTDTLPSLNTDLFLSRAYGPVELSLFGAYALSEGHQLWQDSDIHWTAADDVKRGYRVANLGGKVRWVLDTDRYLTLLAQWNDSDLERLRPYGTIDSDNQREERIATLDYQHRLDPSWMLQLKAYYHAWDSYYSRIDQNESGDIIVMDNNSYWGFEDYGLKAILRWDQQTNQSWLFGAELQRYRGEDEVMEFVSETETVTSLFAQFRPRILNTDFALGLRYSDISGAGDSLNWSIGGESQYSERVRLNASLGTGFRLPTAEELYSVEEEGGIIGDPNLKPEYSLNANLGALVSLSDWTLEPLLFWRQVDDLIGIEDKYFRNLEGQVETYGVELLLNTSGEYWQLDMATSYAKSEEEGSDKQLDEVPKWLASADLNIRASESLQLFIQGHYTGEFTQYQTVAGDYWLLHLGAQYRLARHQFNLRLENALNNDYDVSVFNPGSSAPEEHRDPITTRGTPRNLQFNYRYQF